MIMEELLQTTGAILRRYAGSVSAPSADDMAVLARASKAFPYCTAIDMLMLRSLSLDREQRSSLEMKIMLASDNADAIESARGGDFAGFYPPEENESPATENVIDLFLQTYGHSSPAEDAMLERMIFNPTPDYGEVLAREEQEHLPSEPVDADSPEGRIDAFILSRHPAAQHHRPEPAPQPAPKAKPLKKPADEPADSLLSESLAKIYIRQGKYQRAYDIISSLNLKFPKKSAYFADQLRFLRKLILIDKAGKKAEE